MCAEICDGAGAGICDGAHRFALVVLALRLALWINFSAGDLFKYFFPIFQRKQDLAFHPNCLP